MFINNFEYIVIHRYLYISFGIHMYVYKEKYKTYFQLKNRDFITLNRLFII